MSQEFCHPCDETVQRGDPDFFDAYASGIWLNVIQSLGPQLVAAGFIEEYTRLAAEADYRYYASNRSLAAGAAPHQDSQAGDRPRDPRSALYQTR